jgi:flagellar biosynthesis protein FliQ
MDSDALIDAAQTSLWVLVQMIAPVVLPALGVGLVVGLVQAATSISEATLSFVPKLVATLACLALFGTLMMRVLIDFTLELYDRIPGLLR